MTKFFTDPNSLIEYVNSEEYLKEKEYIYYSGMLSSKMSELHILGHFQWDNLFSFASSAKGLPKTIDGTLTISGVELFNCEGFPETVGNLVMTTTCNVLRWKGLENTTIECVSTTNVLNLPVECDYKYHPHIFKTNSRVQVWFPKNKTRYVCTDLFKLKPAVLNRKIKELLTEDLSQNLLDII